MRNSQDASSHRPPIDPHSGIASARTGRTYWLDYLRAFITVLVVAHHSTLAYTTFAHFNPQAYVASTHPIVDDSRAFGLDVFEDFNDVYFMSLMFLISGIFVLPSLALKGSRIFLRDRFRRLFIPLMITVGLIMPFGYTASWNLAHHNWDLHAFLVDYIAVEHWPAGPAWFIGILFVFNGIISGFYLRWRATLDRWAGSLANHSSRPLALFVRAYILTLILLLPFVLIFGASAWIGFGPFAFQLSRILLYAGYFVVGMLLGAAGTGKGLLAGDSALMRYSSIWLIGCILAYSALGIAGMHIKALEDHNHLNEDPGHPSLPPLLVPVLYTPSVWPSFHDSTGYSEKPRRGQVWESSAPTPMGSTSSIMFLCFGSNTSSLPSLPPRSSEVRPHLRRLPDTQLGHHHPAPKNPPGRQIPVISSVPAAPEIIMACHVVTRGHNYPEPFHFSKFASKLPNARKPNEGTESGVSMMSRSLRW